MACADLVHWVRTANKTGTLRVADDHGREVELRLLDGQFISSVTTDEGKSYASYLYRLDLCPKEDVVWALSQGARGMDLGALLVASRRISRKLAEIVLHEKIAEDVRDLFLWESGVFEFRPAPFEGHLFLPVRLDPLRLVAQGLRRREAWVRLTTTLRPETVLEAIFAPEPEAEAEGWGTQLITRRALLLMDGQRTVTEIAAELPFSRFRVVSSLAKLLQEKRVRILPTHRNVDTGRLLLEEVLRARNSGHLRVALDLLAAQGDRIPESPFLLAELREQYRERVYDTFFEPSSVPVVRVGHEALLRLDLDARAGFVLSRIDGRTPVAQILKLSSMDEIEVLRILERLLEGKVIDFPLTASLI